MPHRRHGSSMQITTTALSRTRDPLLRRCRTSVRCSLLPGEIAHKRLIAGHVIQTCWCRLWVSQGESGCRWVMSRTTQVSNVPPGLWHPGWPGVVVLLASCSVELRLGRSVRSAAGFRGDRIAWRGRTARPLMQTPGTGAGVNPPAWPSRSRNVTETASLTSPNGGGSERWLRWRRPEPPQTAW